MTLEIPSGQGRFGTRGGGWARRLGVVALAALVAACSVAQTAPAVGASTPTMAKAAGTVASVTSVGAASPATATSPVRAAAATTTARQLAAALPVRSEGGSTTYSRTSFKHWIDANGDCQDTRTEVLVAESRVAPTYTSARHCSVSRGRWISPYDYATWTNPSDVDIDHVVALQEAWESGARIWGPVNRERFANDLGHPWSLEAVTDNVNASKGSRDPAQWLPAGPAARGSFAIKWVTVKYRWRLSVDPAERAALLNILSGSYGAKQVSIPARAL